LRKQKVFALERDEIIQRLSNRPIKLHPSGFEDYSTQREIRLVQVRKKKERERERERKKQN